MRFSILGPLEVHTKDARVELAAHKQRLLLAVLIRQNGIPISAEALYEALWNGNPPASARKALSWHVLQLRTALGDKSRIVHHGDGYRLVTGPGEVDHRIFEEKRYHAESLTGSDATSAAAILAEALSLWRGPAYGDLADGILQEEANRLDELHLTTMELRFRLELDLGRHAGLIPELTTLVANHPLREEFRRQLMLALYRGGRQNEALEVFRDGRRHSIDELGLEPGPALRKLEKQILAADPELETVEPVTSGPALAVSLPRPRQLPADTVAFTGREAEVRVLLSQSGSGSTGVLVVSSIDGMAGIGKTALVVHVAHRLADRYPDGQLFIDLHGYTTGTTSVEPGDALDRLIRTMGVAGSQIPSHLDDKAALWRSLLTGKRVLLIIDNAKSERQIRPLLPPGRDQVVMITSRQRLLGLDDARHMTLAPLPMDAAIQLFLACVDLGTPPDRDRKVVERIVRSCGRLPLAIRIAAGLFRRDGELTLEELSSRLSRPDAAISHLSVSDRSVAGAFQLSYRELSATTQNAFQLLATAPVQHLDTTIAAAILDTDVDQAAESLRLLERVHLIEQRADDRFILHDLIRQFARSILPSEGIDERASAALERLSSHYDFACDQASTLMSGQPAHLPSPPQCDPRWRATFADEPQALSWYTAQRLNIQETIETLIAHHDQRYAWRIMASFWLYLQMFGFQGTLRDIAHRALKELDTTAPPFARPTLRRMVGVASALSGDNHAAIEYFEAALVDWRKLNDTVGEAAVLGNLGITYDRISDYEAAIRCQLRTIELAEQADIPKTLASAYSSLANAYHSLHRLEEALQANQTAQALSRRLGNVRSEALAIGNCGNIYRDMGNLDAAISCHRRSLEFCEQDQESLGLPGAHLRLALDYRDQGRLVEAMTHHEQSVEHGERCGDPYELAGAIIEQGATQHGLGRLAAAEASLLRGIELSRRTGSRSDWITGLRYLAALLVTRGRSDEARNALNQALTLAHDQAESVTLAITDELKSIAVP